MINFLKQLFIKILKFLNLGKKEKELELATAAVTQKDVDDLRDSVKEEKTVKPKHWLASRAKKSGRAKPMRTNRLHMKAALKRKHRRQ